MWYFSGGAVWLWLNFYLSKYCLYDIKCSVPNIHLPSIQLNEIRLPEVLRRRQNSPTLPQQQQQQQNFPPQPSYPILPQNFNEPVMGFPIERVYRYPVHQYQHTNQNIRSRRSNTNKECQLNNKTNSKEDCPNIISFYSEDENSIFSTKNKKCLNDFKHLIKQNKRKKRDLRSAWENCGKWIAWIWWMSNFFMYIIGFVLIGIYL
ncbi:hypothetical protein Mgra_00001416 [Meloidogyne graminicola]|uniref:Transmembrane protein n=1 Tax=Meloidogyne graminicola TaxID=189291 RepID=A0A8T0A1I6_9BILA|nr:hypothetical protein Mgra_00001416 [Meloidogyne graminicola]